MGHCLPFGEFYRKHSLPRPYRWSNRCSFFGSLGGNGQTYKIRATNFRLAARPVYIGEFVYVFFRQIQSECRSFSMEKLKIQDVTSKNIDDLVNLCMPAERKSDPQFVEGAKVKSKWATGALKRCGSIAKIAYLNSKPVGLIQYQPRLEERVVEIVCIFVPEKGNFRRGIGKSLLKALLEDVKKPQAFLENQIPNALITWAFKVPGWYPQHEFYQRMGFKKVKENDPFLLYYPLKKGYVYRPKEKKYILQKDDKGKALVFYDPSCPFVTHFTETIELLIKEVAPDIPIRRINKFEEPEEMKKRGQVSSCIVNGKAIQTFFMDRENFRKEVKQALG